MDCCGCKVYRACTRVSHKHQHKRNDKTSAPKNGEPIDQSSTGTASPPEAKTIVAETPESLFKAAQAHAAQGSIEVALEVNQRAIEMAVRIHNTALNRKLIIQRNELTNSLIRSAIERIEDSQKGAAKSMHKPHCQSTVRIAMQTKSGESFRAVPKKHVWKHNLGRRGHVLTNTIIPTASQWNQATKDRKFAPPLTTTPSAKPSPQAPATPPPTECHNHLIPGPPHDNEQSDSEDDDCQSICSADFNHDFLLATSLVNQLLAKKLNVGFPACEYAPKRISDTIAAWLTPELSSRLTLRMSHKFPPNFFLSLADNTSTDNSDCITKLTLLFDVLCSADDSSSSNEMGASSQTCKESNCETKQKCSICLFADCFSALAWHVNNYADECLVCGSKGVSDSSAASESNASSLQTTETERELLSEVNAVRAQLNTAKASEEKLRKLLREKIKEVKRLDQRCNRDEARKNELIIEKNEMDEKFRLMRRDHDIARKKHHDELKQLRLEKEKLRADFDKAKRDFQTREHQLIREKNHLDSRLCSANILLSKSRELETNYKRSCSQAEHQVESLRKQFQEFHKEKAEYELAIYKRLLVDRLALFDAYAGEAQREINEFTAFLKLTPHPAAIFDITKCCNLLSQWQEYMQILHSILKSLRTEAKLAQFHQPSASRNLISLKPPTRPPPFNSLYNPLSPNWSANSPDISMSPMRSSQRFNYAFDDHGLLSPCFEISPLQSVEQSLPKNQSCFPFAPLGSTSSELTTTSVNESLSLSGGLFLDTTDEIIYNKVLNQIAALHESFREPQPELPAHLKYYPSFGPP